MAKLNTRREAKQFTHEGAPAKTITAEQQLRRSVLACMLWERNFYESGETIAERIGRLVEQVPAETVADLALEARTDMNLRHAPLLLAAHMARVHRGNPLAGKTVEAVIQRADELAEILAIHAHINGVTPDKIKSVLGAQIKRGVAQAFAKFDHYGLAKYNRKDAEVRLRDAMFLTHPKPKDKVQEEVFAQLAADTLTPPDTWEVNLSAGADKRETFERLLREGKLGYMALLRNLRKMNEVGVDEGLIREAIAARKGASRVLPFRFVAAARHAPRFEAELDAALVAEIGKQPQIKGTTVVLVDVSASMDMGNVSRKSDLTRMDAAAALASVIPAEKLRVLTFSRQTVEVPPRRGMAGVDAVVNSQSHSGTLLGQAVRDANTIPYDRLIVITDEQSADRVPDPAGRGYMINVASHENGVGYGKWLHIDGFSEAVIRYIQAVEAECVA